MFESIKNCDRCSLCKHQKPLIDEVEICRVFWVGLSAKIATCEKEKPLSPNTNSGSLLCEVERKCVGVPMYRTNLVKCAPQNEVGKLRYPNRIEIDLCLPHLGFEIDALKPQIVFLLGNRVIDAVGRYFSISFDKWDGFSYSFQKHGDVYFAPIHHPSYIYVYKRKRIDAYISGIEKVMTRLL